MAHYLGFQLLDQRWERMINFFLNIVRIMDDQRKFQTQSDCSLKFRTVIAESSDYASLKSMQSRIS